MKRIIHAIHDEKRLVHERLFILLATNALLAMIVVWIMVLITEANRMLLGIIGGGFVIFLALVLFGVRTHRVNLTAWIIALMLIFVMLPLTFFLTRYHLSEWKMRISGCHTG